MAFKLKTVRGTTNNGLSFVMSVVFTDVLNEHAISRRVLKTDFASSFESDMGFPSSALSLSVISSYGLYSPIEALDDFSIISTNINNFLLVNDVTFELNGTLCRVIQDNNIINFQYYDPANDTWRSGSGGTPSHAVPSIGSVYSESNKTIVFSGFIVYVPDLDNVTYESGVAGGCKSGIFSISTSHDGQYVNYSSQYPFTTINDPLNQNIIEYIIGSRNIDTDDPYALMNPSTVAGGGQEGNYNNKSDEMPTTDLYNTSITNGGFLTLFTPTDHEMTTLSNYLGSNSFTDTMKSIFDKIGSLGLSFQDYILSLHRLPVGVPAGPSKIVQLGWYPTNINMTSASAFGGVYDLGSLDIQRYYGNALDYKSRIQIFLPYIGFEDLDTQAVMGKTVTLKYVVDYVSGDCQAQIFVDGSIHYQFKGNMSYHLPVGQDNFSDIIQQGIAVGTSMVVGGAMLNNANQAMNQMMQTPLNDEFSNNIAGPEQEFTASVTGASNAYNNAIKQFQANIGGDITRGGAVGGNSGWFACQVPFIIINRPRLSLPENFGHYHGYPSNITERLGNLEGYTQVGAIHLDDIGCSGYENNLLASNLHSGFNIRTGDIDRPAAFTLYHNDSDLNVVGKDLTSLKTINTIRLKDKTSREKPVFLLTDIDDVFNSINYLYYPDFDRFYVVDSISSVREGLGELQCSVDVLQTYAYRLRNLSGVIDRQEYKYNLYLDDGTLASYANAMVQTINFPVSFNSLGSSNILVILGS